jgi:hypothetical protein
MNPLKTAIIIVVGTIAMEKALEPAKTHPHIHVETTMPITRWGAGVGQFHISGSTHY